MQKEKSSAQNVDTSLSLHIDWCSHEAAKYACDNWHYAKRIPKSKLVKFGVWEFGKFIGAVIFGVGATNKLVNPYGLKPTDGCELVRIALRKHNTPVSKIVSICLRKLKQSNPGLKLVVSFADPAMGHSGGIYKAGNWIYTGKSVNTKYPLVQGRVAHPRMLGYYVRKYGLDRKSVKFIMKEGKHRYLYPLDNETRNRVEKWRKPYPSKNAGVAQR